MSVSPQAADCKRLLNGRTIRHKVMLPTVCIAVDEADNVVVIRPAVMAAHALIVEAIEVFSVGSAGVKHGLPIHEGIGSDAAPAEEKSEPLVVGTAQQMVYPADVIINACHGGFIAELTVGEKQFAFSGLEVDFPNTVIGGSGIGEIFMPHSGLSIPRTLAVEAGKIQAQGITAVV